MDNKFELIKAGKEFAKNHPSASRFDVCQYLIGYAFGQTLTFYDLVCITLEIGVELNKFGAEHNW